MVVLKNPGWKSYNLYYDEDEGKLVYRGNITNWEEETVGRGGVFFALADMLLYATSNDADAVVSQLKYESDIRLRPALVAGDDANLVYHFKQINKQGLYKVAKEAVEYVWLGTFEQGGEIKERPHFWSRMWEADKEEFIRKYLPKLIAVRRGELRIATRYDPILGDMKVDQDFFDWMADIDATLPIFDESKDPTTYQSGFPIQRDDIRNKTKIKVSDAVNRVSDLLKRIKGQFENPDDYDDLNLHHMSNFIGAIRKEIQFTVYHDLANYVLQGNMETVIRELKEEYDNHIKQTKSNVVSPKQNPNFKSYKMNHSPRQSAILYSGNITDFNAIEVSGSDVLVALADMFMYTDAEQRDFLIHDFKNSDLYIDRKESDYVENLVSHLKVSSIRRGAVARTILRYLWFGEVKLDDKVRERPHFWSKIWDADKEEFIKKYMPKLIGIYQMLYDKPLNDMKVSELPELIEYMIENDSYLSIFDDEDTHEKLFDVDFEDMHKGTIAEAAGALDTLEAFMESLYECYDKRTDCSPDYTEMEILLSRLRENVQGVIYYHLARYFLRHIETDIEEAYSRCRGTKMNVPKSNPKNISDKGDGYNMRPRHNPDWKSYTLETDDALNIRYWGKIEESPVTMDSINKAHLYPKLLSDMTLFMTRNSVRGLAKEFEDSDISLDVISNDFSIITNDDKYDKNVVAAETAEHIWFGDHFWGKLWEVSPERRKEVFLKQYYKLIGHRHKIEYEGDEIHPKSALERGFGDWILAEDKYIEALEGDSRLWDKETVMHESEDEMRNFFISTVQRVENKIKESQEVESWSELLTLWVNCTKEAIFEDMADCIFTVEKPTSLGDLFDGGNKLPDTNLKERLDELYEEFIEEQMDEMVYGTHNGTVRAMKDGEVKWENKRHAGSLKFRNIAADEKYVYAFDYNPTAESEESALHVLDRKDGSTVNTISNIYGDPNITPEVSQDKTYMLGVSEGTVYFYQTFEVAGDVNEVVIYGVPAKAETKDGETNQSFSLHLKSEDAEFSMAPCPFQFRSGKREHPLACRDIGVIRRDEEGKLYAYVFVADPEYFEGASRDRTKLIAAKYNLTDGIEDAEEHLFTPKVNDTYWYSMTKNGRLLYAVRGAEDDDRGEYIAYRLDMKTDEIDLSSVMDVPEGITREFAGVGQKLFFLTPSDDGSVLTSYDLTDEKSKGWLDTTYNVISLEPSESHLFISPPGYMSEFHLEAMSSGKKLVRNTVESDRRHILTSYKSTEDYEEPDFEDMLEDLMDELEEDLDDAQQEMEDLEGKDPSDDKQDQLDDLQDQLEDMQEQLEDVKDDLDDIDDSDKQEELEDTLEDLEEGIDDLEDLSEGEEHKDDSREDLEDLQDKLDDMPSDVDMDDVEDLEDLAEEADQELDDLDPTDEDFDDEMGDIEDALDDLEDACDDLENDKEMPDDMEDVDDLDDLKPDEGDSDDMPDDFDPSDMPDDFDPDDLPDDFDPSDMPDDMSPDDMSPEDMPTPDFEADEVDLDDTLVDKPMFSSRLFIVDNEMPGRKANWKKEGMDTHISSIIEQFLSWYHTYMTTNQSLYYTDGLEHPALETSDGEVIMFAAAQNSDEADKLFEEGMDGTSISGGTHAKTLSTSPGNLPVASMNFMEIIESDGKPIVDKSDILSLAKMAQRAKERDERMGKVKVSGSGITGRYIARGRDVKDIREQVKDVISDHQIYNTINQVNLYDQITGTKSNPPESLGILLMG